jgi:hypothetical protein
MPAKVGADRRPALDKPRSSSSRSTAARRRFQRCGSACTRALRPEIPRAITPAAMAVRRSLMRAPLSECPTRSERAGRFPQQRFRDSGCGSPGPIPSRWTLATKTRALEPREGSMFWGSGELK